ncbi:hypothetical protein K456DRAFT_1923540 [Colletotrichum gloeosporioides 23]|nr:hypothetical protein K456DRAFT_1923540 [Colletotrichum gloeosporioides 23]
MLSIKFALFLAPLLALASPVDIQTRQNNECCYETEVRKVEEQASSRDYKTDSSQDINKLVFRTNGTSGQFLDTLSWCMLQVDRDASDPNNCEKATRSYWAGYCPESPTKVISCPSA